MWICLPNDLSVASTIFLGADGSARFARTLIAAEELGRAIISSINFAALASDDGDVYVTTTSRKSQNSCQGTQIHIIRLTFAPRRANSVAISAPKPRADPVTIAILPSKV